MAQMEFQGADPRCPGKNVQRNSSSKKNDSHVFLGWGKGRKKGMVGKKDPLNLYKGFQYNNYIYIQIYVYIYIL